MPLPNTTILHHGADSAPAKQKITDDRVHTYVRFSREMRKKLRLLAAERDLTMTDVITEAMNNYLRSQGDTEQ